MPESEAGLPSSVTGAGQETTPQQESFVHKETLPNGLRVLIHEMPGAQATTAEVLVRAGPRYEDAATLGSGHILEHVNYNGSKKYPLPQDLRARGIEAGAIDYAYTQRELISYRVQLPPNKIAAGLDYLHELVFHPTLTEESVEAEKETIAHERRYWLDRPDDDFLIWNLLNEHAWGDHPVGQNPMGTAESLQSVSSQSLAEYHKRFFTPNNSILVISGNVTPQQAMDMVTNEFGSLPSSTEAVPNVSVAKRSGENRVMIEQRDFQQAYLALTFDTNGHGRSSDLLPQIQVLSALLHLQLHNDFVYRLRYAYNAGSYPLTLSDDGQIVLRADVAPDNALNAMKKMIELVKDLPIDESAVHYAKTYTKNSILTNPADTNEDTKFIGQQELFKGEVLSLEETKAKIDAISVEDIQRLKDTLLTAANAGMVILGNIPPERKTEFEGMLDAMESE